MPDASAVKRMVIRHPEQEILPDLVAVEEPLEIRIDGVPLAVTMRTPGHDRQLAAGFCLTEGIIDSPDQIERVEPCFLADYGNIVDVILSEEARPNRQQQLLLARREFYLSSSCGLCGTQSIDRLARHISPLDLSFQVSASLLDELPAKMFAAQEAFAHTGGLHASALFDLQGNLRLLHEDVGRHNALDKVIGDLLLSGQIPCGPAILLLSGRVSFELVQKAARAGIAFICAVGAPSSLAIDSASRFGITLIGFLRSPGRFNIYAEKGRLAE